MDFIKSWIYTIVVIIIFAAFIDLLMPSSSMKKYVKLVLGLIIMSVILQPVLKLAKKDFNIDTGILSFQSEIDRTYLQKQTEYYSKGQEAEIIRVYKQNIEKNMEQQINSMNPNIDVKVSVDVDEDRASEKYGKIKKVSVAVGKQVKSVTKVDKVKIGQNTESDANDKKNADGDYNEIKNKISSILGVEKDRISISFLN